MQGAPTAEHVRIVREVNNAKSLYDVLGLDRNCTEEDIKKAYKKKALKLHPDKNSAPGAEDAFKKVAEAMQVLSSGDDRAYYDQTGSTKDAAQRNAGPGVHTQFNNVDPEQIFRMFFGGDMGGMNGMSFHMGPMGGFQQFGHGNRTAQRRRTTPMQRRPNQQAAHQNDEESNELMEKFKPVLLVIAAYLWFVNPNFFFLLLFLYQMFGRLVTA